MSTPNTSPIAVERSPASSPIASTTPMPNPKQAYDVLIVVEDDEDDEIKELTNRLGMTTLYSIGNTQTTSYWSTGAAAQRAGSPVRAEGVRIRYHIKPTAWVVYIGILPGVYHRWVDAEEQVVGQSRAVCLSYHSRRDAARAFSFALSKEWVASTLDTEHPLIRPRPAYHVSFVRPKVNMLSAPTLIGTGLSRPAWQIVYVGVRPGVYDNFLQVSLNVAGITGSTYESVNTRQEAVRLYMRAYGRGEVGTCITVQ